MPRRSNQAVKKINLAAKNPLAGLPLPAGANDDDTDLALMGDARYLRQSASLISEALQKGFDVLQLANGDIITTGTKTVIYTYTWDQEKAKLVRTKTSGAKRAKAKSQDSFIDDEQDEMEDA